jgi:hypothetical protein
MVFRFQKRIKIAPGFSINVSKRGVSASIGGGGATLNLSSKGLKTNFSIPGSGLSWSAKTGWSNLEHLKATDQLHQLCSFMDRRADEFNLTAPQTAKIAQNWEKSKEIFFGGRGPSNPKHQTLTKRYDNAMAEYEKIDQYIVEHTNALSAVIERLNFISLGIFQRSLKRKKQQLLELARAHEACTQELSEIVTVARKKIDEDLILV